jgi:signal transduction histidine kinase
MTQPALGMTSPTHPMRAGVLMVATPAAIVTLLVLLFPATRVALVSPSSRIALEMLGLSALVVAAVILSLPDEEDRPTGRDGLVAALVTMALANVAFGVGPALLGARFEIDRGLALYPWIAARNLAGAWFILAAFGRPRRGLAVTLGWAILALVAVESVLIGVGDRLSVPVQLSADATAVVVVDPVAHVLLQVVPAALFAVGSWLAGRLHLRTDSVIARWVSLALLLQSFAQVHEIIAPAMLGPVITSADLFRLSAFALLLAGSFLHLRGLYRSRAFTVRAQQSDLRAHTDLIARLSAAAEQEQLFRAIVSHELATPIATVRAFSELLAARLPEPRGESIDEALEGLRGEATRLLELVGRLDELRDLEHAEFDCALRPVRIVPILEESLGFIRGLEGRSRIRLEAVDLRVLADPVRFGQLLRNLLVNAVRFSPPSSPVDVTGSPDSEGRYEVTVRDRGPGIPVEERELVLLRSARGSNAVGTEGRGLGLWMADRIAVAHGAPLSIEDAADGGACIRVRLEVLR